MNTNNTVKLIYRRMLYTLMDVFKGDYQNFHMMRIMIRRKVEENNNETDIKKINQQIIDFEEARKTISSSIIQGKLQEGGFYRYKARPDLFQGSNVDIKDKIKEDLEISDESINDLEKKLNSDKKV